MEPAAFNAFAEAANVVVTREVQDMVARVSQLEAENADLKAQLCRKAEARKAALRFSLEDLPEGNVLQLKCFGSDSVMWCEYISHTQHVLRVLSQGRNGPPSIFEVHLANVDGVKVMPPNLAMDFMDFE